MRTEKTEIKINNYKLIKLKSKNYQVNVLRKPTKEGD
jgi:hypothetical protein